MANNIGQFFFDVVKSTLSSSNSTYSEKRVTRMFVVICMMTLTIWDFIHAKSLRIEIFYAWLGFAGYDGWRIMNEKKVLKATADKMHATTTTTAVPTKE